MKENFLPLRHLPMKILKLLLSLTIAFSLVACVPSNQQSTTPPLQQPAATATDARVIRVTSENWKFSPNVITVKKGEKVQLQVTGVSGTHGFAVPDLGINVPVPPGQTVTIDLPTDKEGTFALFCSIFCGSGHSGMKGRVVIE